MFSNTGVRYGLLGGVVVVAYFILLYAIDRDLFLNLRLQWASLVFYLVFMWLAAKVDCAEHGVSRDFREILRTPFIVFLLINLCYWVFFYALHLFDLSLVETELIIQKNIILAQLETGVGDPKQGSLLREGLVDIEKELEGPLSVPLMPIIQQMFKGALGGFGMAALVALIFRSKD